MISDFISLKPRKPRDLILGSAPLAGLYRPVDPVDARETIRMAIHLGWGGIDTAPSYGLGAAENIIGEVMKEHNKLSGRTINIFTKIGRVLVKRSEAIKQMNEIDTSSPGMFETVFQPVFQTVFQQIPQSPDESYGLIFDYSVKGIYKSFIGSQKRMGYPIHGLRLHDAETMDRFNDVIKYNSINTLLGLKQQGLINAISIGMNDPRYILRILESYPGAVFDNVMMAGSWNLLDQSGMEVLVECHKRKIPVINAGIFGSGLLWGGDTLRYSKASKEDIARVRSWDCLAVRYDLTLPVVALAFAFLPQIVESVCIGARSPGELIENHNLLSQIHSVPIDMWREAIDKNLLSPSCHGIFFDRLCKL